MEEGIKKLEIEIKAELLNSIMANQFDKNDKFFTMQTISTAGKLARHCIRESVSEDSLEYQIYEKALEDIIAVCIFSSVINNGNTQKEVEHCLEDIGYLEMSVQAVEEYYDDLLVKCTTDSLKKDVLEINSIFHISNKKYDELRMLYEDFVCATS